MVTAHDVLAMIEPVQIFTTLGAAVNFGAYSHPSRHSFSPIL